MEPFPSSYKWEHNGINGIRFISAHRLKFACELWMHGMCFIRVCVRACMRACVYVGLIQSHFVEIISKYPISRFQNMAIVIGLLVGVYSWCNTFNVNLRFKAHQIVIYARKPFIYSQDIFPFGLWKIAIFTEWRQLMKMTWIARTQTHNKKAMGHTYFEGFTFIKRIYIYYFMLHKIFVLVFYYIHCSWAATAVTFAAVPFSPSSCFTFRIHGCADVFLLNVCALIKNRTKWHFGV